MMLIADIYAIIDERLMPPPLPHYASCCRHADTLADYATLIAGQLSMLAD